jgi:hypothetical protein
LTSIDIPNKVTDIGRYAFSSCNSLTSVAIPNSVLNLGDGAFQFCSGLSSITLSNSLTSISEKTLEGCVKLTSVNIPVSVTRIRTSALDTGAGLTSITVNWTTPLAVDRNIFGALNLSSIALNVPSGTAQAYKSALVWKEFGTNSLGTDNFSVNTPIKFYPNPAQSQINFTQEINTLEVFDIAGKKVKAFQNPNTTFDVSTLGKGVYMLTGTTTDGKSSTEKLVKE